MIEQKVIIHLKDEFSNDIGTLTVVLLIIGMIMDHSIKYLIQWSWKILIWLMKRII